MLSDFVLSIVRAFVGASEKQTVVVRVRIVQDGERHSEWRREQSRHERKREHVLGPLCLGGMHGVEYYSAVKKDEIVPHATAWMGGEGILLKGNKSDKEKKNCLISLICGIQKTNE